MSSRESISVRHSKSSNSMRKIMFDLPSEADSIESSPSSSLKVDQSVTEDSFVDSQEVLKQLNTKFAVFDKKAEQVRKEKNPLFPIDVDGLKITAVPRKTRVKREKESKDQRVTDVRVKEGIKLLSEDWMRVETPFLAALAEENAKIPKTKDEKSKFTTGVLKTVAQLPLHHHHHHRQTEGEKAEERKPTAFKLDDKLIAQPHSLDTFKEVYDGAVLPNGQDGAYQRVRLFHALQPRTLDVIGYDRSKPMERDIPGSRVELCASVQNVHEPLVATLCVYDAKRNEKLTENFVALCGPNGELFGQGASALNRCVLHMDYTSDTAHVLVLLTKLMQGSYDDVVSFYTKANPSSKDSSAYEGKLKEIAALATCTQAFGIAEIPCKNFNGTNGNTLTLNVARIKDSVQQTIEKLFSANMEKHIKYFPNIKVELTARCLNGKDVPSGYGRDHLLRELKHTEKDKKAQYIEVFEFTKEHTGASSFYMQQAFGSERRHEGTREVMAPAVEYYDVIYFSPECANFSDYSGACSARNILVEAEVRPSEAADAAPLPVFVRPTPYGEELSATVEFPVQYHTRKPTFSLFDQVKIRLPKDVNPNFHLVVNFYHIDCKWKKGAEVKTKIGVCVVPLFTSTGRIASGRDSARILPELPDNYLRDAYSGEQEKDKEGLAFTYAFKVVSTVHSTVAAIDDMMRFTELTKAATAEQSPKVAIKIIEGLCSKNSRVSLGERLMPEKVLFSPYILRRLFKLSTNSDETISARAFDALVEFIKEIAPHSQAALNHYVANLRSSEKFMELIDRANAYRVHRKCESYITTLLMAAIWKSVALTYERRKLQEGAATFSEQEIETVSDFLVSVARDVSKMKVVIEGDMMRKELGVFVGNLFYVFPVSTVLSLVHRILYELCGQSVTESTLVPLACCKKMTPSYLRSVSRFIAVLTLHPSFVGLGFPGSSPAIGEKDACEFASMEAYCEQHYLVGTLVSLASFIGENRETANDFVETVYYFFYRLDADAAAKSDAEQRTQEMQRKVLARLLVPMLTLIIEKYQLRLPENSSYSGTSFFVGAGLRANKHCIPLVTALWLMKEMDSSTLKWFFANKVSLDGLKKLVEMFKEVQSELLFAKQDVEQEVPASADGEAGAVGQTPSEKAPDLARTSTPVTGKFTSKSISLANCDSTETKKRIEMTLCGTKTMVCFAEQPSDGKVDLSAKLSKEAERITNVLRFEASAVMLDALMLALASRFPAYSRVKNDAITTVIEFIIAMNSEQQSDDFNRLTFEAYHRIISPFKNYFFIYHNPISSQMVSKLIGFTSKASGFQVVASSLLFNMILNNFYAAKNFYRMRLRMTVGISELSGKKDVLSFAGVKGCLDAICKRICAADVFKSDDSARIDEEAKAVEAELLRKNKVYRNGKVPEYAMKTIRRDAQTQAAKNIRDLNAQFSKTAKTEMSDIKARLLNVIESCEKQKRLEYDPEATCDLFYHISEEFVDSPDLRIAWLNNLAQVHLRCENFDQYVQTKLLIALLVAEYLTLTDRFTDTPINAENWKRVSPYCDLSTLSLPTREHLMVLKDDICTGEEFSFEGFKATIEDAVAKQKSGSFRERCIEIYHILLPYYIDKRDFKSQEPIYEELHNICRDFIKDSERIIPNYYRVGFYGKSFKEFSGRMFVYSSRLRLPDFVKHITKQFEKGGITFEVAPNSKTPSELQADKSKNFVQICNVLKYFDSDEMKAKSGIAEVDLHFGVSKFVLTLPIPGKTENDTRKKRTVYYAKGKFPGIFSRLEIDQSKTIEKVIEPIDVSRELIEEKHFELKREVMRKTPDIKRLQMLLMGSLLATVNLGPLKIVEHYFVNNDPHENPQKEALVKLGVSMVEFGKTLRSGVELNSNYKTDAMSELCDKFEHAMGEFDATIQQYVIPFCDLDE